MAQDAIRAEGITQARVRILDWHRDRHGWDMDAAILRIEGERAGTKIWVLSEVNRNPGNTASPWREVILLDDFRLFRKVFDHPPTDGEIEAFKLSVQWE